MYVPAGHARASKPSRRCCGSERERQTRTQDALKGFLVPLVQRGYLHRETRKGSYASPTSTRAPSGVGPWRTTNAQVRLPPPAFVVDAERRERARADERRAELEAAGANISSIPPDQLAAGGETPSYQPNSAGRAAWKDGARTARPTARPSTRQMLDRVLAWRAAAARGPRDFAPATVLPDHLAKNCAYSMPTTAAALREIGVRFGAGADELAALIDRAGRELGLSVAVSANEDTGVAIALPRGPRSFAAWPLAVEKPSKKPSRPGIVTSATRRGSQGRELRRHRREPGQRQGHPDGDRRQAWFDGPRPRARGGPRAPRGRRRRGAARALRRAFHRDLAQVRGGGALGGRRPAARREVRHQGPRAPTTTAPSGGMADVFQGPHGRAEDRVERLVNNRN